MQTAISSNPYSPPGHAPVTGTGTASAYAGYQIIRRNGAVVAFEPHKIAVALMKAFLAVRGAQGAASASVREAVDTLTESVVRALLRSRPSGGTFHIEDVQDQVELGLMRGSHHDVARAYVLYRERHAQERLSKGQAPAQPPTELVVQDHGQRVPLNQGGLQLLIESACAGLGDEVTAAPVLAETRRNLYDGVPVDEVYKAAILAARTLIEKDPGYTRVTARLLMHTIRREVLGDDVQQHEMADRYVEYFPQFIRKGIDAELLDERMAQFDLVRLGAALKPERDMNFDYLGLQTLYDRYFLHVRKQRIELPQAFFMRVAMGLALGEIDREGRAIEFYEVLSTFDFMSSTPTLFNAGTRRSQLSSCYLTTVPDDLDGIYEAIKDNALLSKFAGGLGNDWTSVRALGSHIKGTNGESQGVVPFLKVVNDTAVAVNQGGKRKGAVCAYLESWHLDIEEFLELRKNTGDDRRRTHDMNTANWIPDLFMRRVMEGGDWTLFSPSTCPDLHDLFGIAFEQAYTRYEAMAQRGEIKLFKRIRAVDLWRKMLSMLFETGHPWITFKDACNVRSPQQHVGVVHSSNLCCMTADQRVVTDRGIVTVGELFRSGGKNKVVGLDGVYDASEMLLPRPDAPIVRIETEEGYSHKVTPDHKVWVKDRGWVEAQHLTPGDKLLIQQLEGLWGQRHEPKLGYLMGLIAGDGTFGEHNVFIDVWEQDFDLLEPTTQVVHEVLDGNTVLRTTSVNTPVFRIDPKVGKARLASAPLRRLLAEHDFTPETKTTVPELVWQGDRETVAAYLRGLYLADGNVVSSGEVTTLALASIDRKFIEDLQVLWANFGVKSSINQMRGHQEHELPDGQGGKKLYWSKPLYRLLITSIQGCRIAESVTQLAASRKSDAAAQYLRNLQKTGYQQKLHATFKGLVELPNEDAYCLSVNSETHAWTVNGMITKNTEITLNTNASEIAVCNLGSVNLAHHLTDGADGAKVLDTAKLKKTISTAMRMLDNVIDINYYAVKKARDSNLRHRPVGLGLMGFQDALYQLRVPYASQEAVEFADRSMEAICYHAYWASTDLAAERGRYQSYAGSLWDRGILPLDSLKLLAEQRGGYVEVDTSSTLDWDALRTRIGEVGMRNSNCVAIAPTATISNIIGVDASIEPSFGNLSVKSNLSGEFTIVNEYLVRDLKKLGLWDDIMVMDLKHFDGSLRRIDRVPEELKRLYATAFEVEPRWLVEAGARRQKWIDQAQSLNIYMAGASGKKLDETYKLAWVRGLKTTYYLRTTSASNVEKSTVGAGSHNAVSASSAPSAFDKAAAAAQALMAAAAGSAPATDVKFCAIDDPGCEACQ
ncbi:ribonucleoside-diphosphate reductase subunit alpha [Sphaerotilus sp.]|uniref:ribonucleoside-diphosphate reductase subunit alpha n=1 Tax=Sphaerotilus sp. TaxID=2093942 RepID=UPI002ACD2548|nr:ribonucleoside-diphosphate reductase subunit alpha [Sphaerotilus sp.]MDZ7854709.1 ribonucleoside-diphosphate reductase subunit alpha [Sphaerotilus sp.]